MPTKYLDAVGEKYNDTLAYMQHIYKNTMGLRDARVDGWLLMDSPWPTLCICLLYVFSVTNIGPRIMKNRKPLELRRLLIFYNFFMVIFSAWMCYELWVSGWGSGYSYRCQPVDYSNTPKALRMARACWWYYFSKFIEFTDTFFFILRKKFNHVSLLHVIHHGCMPMSVWFGVRFTPGGHSTFFGLLNTFVHVFMYTYYGMAALGPRYHKWLWWKQYMTTLQMVQFVGIMAHAFQLLFLDCDYPKAFVWWIGGHAVMFFILFSDFYKSAYLIRAVKRTRAIANGHDKTRTNGVAKENGLKAVSNGHVTNGYVKKEA